MAMKLARMVGTSFNFWMSLQNSYDELIVEFKSEEELEREQQVFSVLDYKYFRDNFGLPDLPRKIDEQIKAVRKFLEENQDVYDPRKIIGSGEQSIKNRIEEIVTLFGTKR